MMVKDIFYTYLTCIELALISSCFFYYLFVLLLRNQTSGNVPKSGFKDQLKKLFSHLEGKV
jgi:hypothetical protein